jgi:hypothetical protein
VENMNKTYEWIRTSGRVGNINEAQIELRRVTQRPGQLIGNAAENVSDENKMFLRGVLSEM